ncbi:four-carbon acid sugar kinase family protein [Shinella daejeonensis]|uniref:3-oxo-tetronate kinase n=1 Tax=Shinella daejeonensis TaxID=659017 RepID=UPI0020C82FC4|nr:3-oxo-tetronate kinase [Shinella daejeonensis]MCP8894568.1 four-carbon acid sugar kinase family protein [Shinella daejeonensis]
MTENLLFGAIGDDLTGAMDLASLMVASGIKVDVRVGVPDGAPDPDAPVAVVALKSRVAPPEEATAQMLETTRWLAQRSPRQFFFKYCGTFDSTPAGNIGCCTDVLSDFTGADHVFFIPANPARHRSVYNGHLFFEGQLLSESPRRFDPLTPMTESDLVKVLTPQTGVRVGLLPRHVVAEGKDAMRAHLQEMLRAGKRYIIADAICEEDMASLADLTVDDRVMTGNNTIAGYYPALWRERGLISGDLSPAPLPPVAGPGAILAGSCSPQTLRQLEVFRDGGGEVLFLDLLGPECASQIAEQSLAWAEGRIGSRPLAIAMSASPDQVSKVQARFGRMESAAIVENVLGTVAVGLTQRGVSRLVVAGGETSGAVIGALGIRKLQAGAQINGNIPLAIGDIGKPIGLCLKSGKLGGVDVFNERLAAMEAGTF